MDRIGMKFAPSSASFFGHFEDRTRGMSASTTGARASLSRSVGSSRKPRVKTAFASRRPRAVAAPEPRGRAESGSFEVSTPRWSDDGLERRRRRRRRVRASADDEAAWSSAGTLNPELSYDEEFCIIDKGCGHVLRQLTASPEDVERLDALLREVSFDASVEEWLALLKSSDDSDGDAAPVGGVTGATGVFDEDGDLVGFGSTVVYGGDTDAPFGWVGNVVVRSDYRKRGVASMVLRAALDSMGASTLAVLDASAMGAPLYLKAGFAPVAAVRRWTLSRDDALERDTAGRNGGTAGQNGGTAGRQDAAADWSAGDGALIADMDAAVFGAPAGTR